jgi:hypothetical protein
MERLFSPCNRLYDLLESQGFLDVLRGYHPELFQELNLDVSTEELLSSERALRKRDTISWLTPHAAVVSRRNGGVVYCWGELNGSCRFCLCADGKDIVFLARSAEHLMEICDVVVRLLTASDVHSVIISKCSSLDRALMNASTLAYLMEQCQSMKMLSLIHLEMDEIHCRVIGAYSRPGLKIVLSHCQLTSAGTSALAEILGRNEGPTQLDSCQIDNSVLADGLRGNSLLESFRPRFSSDLEFRDREFLAIAGAVKENKGLVDLDLSYALGVSDEIWGAICDSLEKHPTLEVLDLSGIFLFSTTAPPAVLKSRIQVLIDMMKVKMSIHTIHLHSQYSRNELFRGSVIPYLDKNRFRPRVRAIQKTRPIAYRAKVLGQALLAARTDANRFWMILSGNAEVAFPSTTTPTASLPTPVAAATAAITSSTENDADIAAFVMSALTTNAAGSLPTAAVAAAPSF